MACDTRKSTIKTLVDKDIIDEDTLILNLPEFNRLNEVYSNTAREKYGIDGGLLFDVETTVKERNEKTRESTSFIRRALANIPMFDKLDIAVDLYENPKNLPTSDGLIPKIPTSYKSLTKGYKQTLQERNPAEQARIKSLVIPRMQEILTTLGVTSETVERLYVNQQEINRLQALLANVQEEEAKADIKKQIADLKNEGEMEETAALADTMNRLIQFAEGQLSDDNLTEETVHFIVDIIEQKYPKMFDELTRRITQFPIYSEVKEGYADDKLYQTAEGRPNFAKLKKEAIAQLLVQHLLYPEEEVYGGNAETWIGQMWFKVASLIKDLFKTLMPDKREAFREVAERILYDPEFISAEDYKKLGSEAFEAKKIKGARKVLAKLAYEMREMSESLKDVLPEWAKTGIKPHFENNEDMWKFLEKVRKEITLQKVEVGRETDGTPIYDNRYFYKGVQLPERTSTVITEALGKAKGFTNLSKMTEREILRESKKEKGTAVHADIQNILSMYIDPETGLLREVPLDEVAAVHTNFEVWQALDEHVYNRIKSYPEGTRFSVELPIVNWLEGYAGTIDFLAIMPDMTVDILDWKTNEVFQRSEWLGTTDTKVDVSPFDQRYWKEQLKLYKRALFHAGLNNFRYTRAIPIATKFKRIIIDPSLPKTDLTNIRYDLERVEIGSHDVKGISRRQNYLVPVSIETEKTGNEKLDDLLKKLWGLRNRLQNSRHSGEEGIKFTEIERVANAIRELQVRRTAASLVTVFTANFIRYQSLAKKETPWLAELKPGQAFTDDETAEKIEEYIKELTDAHDFLKSFENFASVIRSVYPNTGLSLLDERDLEGIQDIETNAASIQDSIDQRLQSVANTIGAQFNIADVNAKDFTNAAYRFIFSNLFNREERSIQLFGRVKNSMDAVMHTKLNAEIDRIQAIKEKLDKFLKDNNLTREELFGKVTDPETGRLINKISPAFWDTLARQREFFIEVKQNIVDKFKDVKFRDQTLIDKMNALYEKEVMEWLKDNINLEQFQESYDKRREGYVKYLNDTTFSDDPNMDQNKKEQLLSQWEKNNNILAYPEALRRGNNSLRVQEEKWFTPEFQALLKPGSEFLKELYDYFQGLNIRAIENGMMDDIYGPTLFTPQIERSDFKYRFKQSVLNKIKSFKFLYLFVTSRLKNQGGLANEAIQSDLLDESDEVDPVTDRRILFIPVYYKRLAEEKQRETDVFHSFAKWAEHIANYEAVKEFEQRLNLARVVEALKTETINTNKWGLPKRRADDPTLYDTIKKTGATADVLERYIERYVYNRSEAKDINPTLRAVLDGLYTYTMLKYLALNIPAFVSNVVGGAIRRNAIAMGYVKKGDLTAAHRISAGVSDPFVKATAGDVEDLPSKAAFLKDLFFTGLSDTRDINEYTREFGSGLKHSDSKATISEWALAGFRVGDRLIQDPLAYALFMNAAFVDGKLVNIPTYVRSLYPAKYQGKDWKSTEKEINKKIEELRKQNLFTLVEGKDGDYSLKGFKPESAEGRSNALRLSNLARGLSKDALGNTSLADVSQARMMYLMRALLQFKNWMPWQMKTFFGKLQYNYEKDTLEVGRIRALVHMMTHGAFARSASLVAFNIIPILSTLGRRTGVIGAPTNQAMIDAGKQIYVEHKQYLRERNEDVPFSEAQMVDLYREAVNAEMKELQAITTFMLISGVAALVVQKGREHWYSSLLARANFMIWNELTQAYDPSSMTYTLQHGLPIVSAIDDFVKIWKAFGKKALGTATAPVTTGALHKKANRLKKNSHPLYEILNATPVVRQMNTILMAHSQKWSYFLGKPQPKSSW